MSISLNLNPGIPIPSAKKDLKLKPEGVLIGLPTEAISSVYSREA